ncbi:MAG: hypothetical protein PHR83_00435 [Paludibacter sp.]|nr:hypothetical protein [Paludibacter sp.]
MKKFTLNILTIILLCSCDNSRWETINGNGINDDPKTIDNVIYFENENNGLVGGYTLVKDKNAKTEDGFVLVPTLFLTNDCGKNWKEVKFDPNLRASVDNAYLHGDTLICQLDSLILFSTDKGNRFQTINNSLKRNKIVDHYFKANIYNIKDHDFLFNEKKYYIKERYQNDIAIVIVCYGEKTLTDYYFVSFDKGNTWTFLQDLFGDNRARYLFEDKFLYCYAFPFGLQRLKLK